MKIENVLRSVRVQLNDLQHQNISDIARVTGIQKTRLWRMITSATVDTKIRFDDLTKLAEHGYIVMPCDLDIDESSSRYVIAFRGRNVNSIGATRTIVINSIGTSHLTKEQVRLKLYERYDHITDLTVEEKTI